MEKEYNALSWERIVRPGYLVYGTIIPKVRKKSSVSLPVYLLVDTIVDSEIIFFSQLEKDDNDGFSEEGTRPGMSHLRRLGFDEEIMVHKIYGPMSESAEGEVSKIFFDPNFREELYSREVSSDEAVLDEHFNRSIEERNFLISEHQALGQQIEEISNARRIIERRENVLVNRAEALSRMKEEFFNGIRITGK